MPDDELKACQADLKAAVDALPVIVRTLEKVDEMERRIMRDQAELAALPASEAAYERLIGEVERAIEARVAERLSRIDASRDGQADARPPPDPGDNLPAMEPADVR